MGEFSKAGVSLDERPLLVSVLLACVHRAPASPPLPAPWPDRAFLLEMQRPDAVTNLDMARVCRVADRGHPPRVWGQGQFWRMSIQF